MLVFNVETGRSFYGPGGGYSMFAARDASLALATMNLKEENADVSQLNEKQQKVLADWAEKYLSKYPVVGVLQ